MFQISIHFEWKFIYFDTFILMDIYDIYYEHFSW
jgi:hypothetical protein